MQFLEQRAVAALLRARQTSLHVLERELEIVPGPQPPHVEIGGGAQDLRIVRVESHRPGVRGARLVDVAQFRQRGAAEMVRGHAGRITAARLACALERVLVAACLEIARRLVQQVGERRFAASGDVEARCRGSMGLAARVGGGGVERLGDGRRRAADER